MSDDPFDPLDELRDAWRRVTPPERPEGAGDPAEQAARAWLARAWGRLALPRESALSGDDPTVAWMRGAWKRMETPTAERLADAPATATSAWAKAAWQRVRPGEPAESAVPGSVRWVQQAWTRVEAPATGRVLRPRRGWGRHVTPLRAAAAFLVFTLSAGVLLDDPGQVLASADSSALHARIAREHTSFFVPQPPRQASVVPLPVLDARLAAGLSELLFGTGMVRGLLPGDAGEAPGSGEAAGRLARLRQAVRDGAWSDAVELGQSLVDVPQLDHPSRCEARAVLTHAYRCLGQFDLANTEQQRLERELTAAARPEPAQGLLPADPGGHGLHPTALARHLRLAQETGAEGTVVVHRGQIVSEWYAPGSSEAATHRFDAGGVLALLTGILLADGRLPDLHAPLPGVAAGDARITLHDLLTHTSGLERGRRGLTVTPEFDPGSAFLYGSADLTALWQVLEAAAGVPLAQFATERLFGPIGAAAVLERGGDQGPVVVATARDMALVGMLVLERGRIQDQVVVPESWIERCAAPGHHRADHGYLWWLCDEPRGMASLGALDNNLYVFPGQGLVIVRAQSTPKPDVPRGYEPEALSLFGLLATR